MAENTTQAALDANIGAVRGATTIVVQKRSSLSILALVLILAIVGGGGAAWIVSQSKIIGSDHGRPGQSTMQIVHLEGFTVNLSGAEENNFVRVTMDLELERMPPPVDRDKPASGLPVARIRDTIIAVLAASKAEPLLTADGKIQLKKTLRDELNRRVPEMNVREIYFTEFLVQR